MNRREFLTALGLVAVSTNSGCASAGSGVAVRPRRVKKIGIQLYTLRDDARRDLEGTLVNIAQIGYKEVELLGSMNNFGMAPERLRSILDRNGLVAPSTHVETGIFNDLDRQIDIARILGHQYLIVASLPDAVIATVGLANDIEVWARDPHFPMMQLILPALKLYQEPP